AYMISIGNQACLGMHDYIDALCEDDRVSAIGLHIEGIPDVIAFCDAAIKALRKGVPIVALATGRSELGRKTTISHTSSLAASSNIMDALFDRLGIARVKTLPEFLETLKLLSVNGALPGNKIGSISCSGGEAALTADLANTLGLEIPPLNDKQRQDLENVLGERVLLANPLDYHTYIWGDGDAQQRCFAAMAQGEQDITLKIIDFPHEDTLGHWKQTAEAFVGAVKQTKSRGAVVSTLPETLPESTRDYLVKSGVAPMQGLGECLVAIQAAAHIGQCQRAVDNIHTVLDTKLRDGNEIVLDERQSKKQLQQYGLPIPRGEVVTQQNASNIAEDIGFPVVMKAVGENIQHKSELNAVKLNLNSIQDVSNAVIDLSQHSEQYLLEQMVDDAVAELIVGITRHDQFGLAMIIGSGGVLTELVQDTVTLLLPITESEIIEALQRLRVMRLLEGYRGNPAGDIDACVAAILSIATFAQDTADCLLELDVNPLMVLPESQGVVAADALIRIVQK
ncbi:MAG: acetate--CoA ligase family protein, partial [Gammaproteobacteria bacterium]|nr:acetate--CoA ligase family protein [Gammaproteobacteria bacterium]